MIWWVELPQRCRLRAAFHFLELSLWREKGWMFREPDGTSLILLVEAVVIATIGVVGRRVEGANVAKNRRILLSAWGERLCRAVMILDYCSELHPALDLVRSPPKSPNPSASPSTVPPAPPEGRDGATLRRTRLRPLAGDAPVGSAPLTGSADEEGGEGSEVRRRRRTILGAANVRRPMLSSAFGARFLGR